MVVKYYMILLAVASICSADTCPGSNSAVNSETRYLLYTVNLGEGFNLRRDVYVRLANLVKLLNAPTSKKEGKYGTSNNNQHAPSVDDKHNNQHWVLVLPPWWGMYHWFRSRGDPAPPWSEFFDVASMNKYIPVMELSQYLKEVGGGVSGVYGLQEYSEGWGTQWEEKYEERPCLEEHQFTRVGEGWTGVVAGLTVRAGRMVCLSMQGTAGSIVPLLSAAQGHSFLLSRAEVLLHDDFAGSRYWAARRSMRYAAPLVAAATDFRASRLHSSDGADDALLPLDWRDEKPRKHPPKGGPYLSVHLRRRDFLGAKPGEVPSIESAAKQIRAQLNTSDLHRVFLATDAPQNEVNQLKSLLEPQYEVVQFTSQDEGGGWTDGHVAIIDQIIAAYARHFVGSHESTFSYRVAEAREILGFTVATTFNRLCGSRPACAQPAHWVLVY